MKKLLIVNNNMYLGGVQKALVSLLWNIYQDYDITLLLFHAAGPCIKELPPGICVEQVSSAYRYLGMNRSDASRNLKDRLFRNAFALICRIFGRKTVIHFTNLTQKQIKGYDISISYLHNGGSKAFYGGCNDFVLNKVEAEQKITFLHCDYLNSGANTEENAKQLAQFDKIAACSDGCAQAFLTACPELKNKVFTVRNCHRFKEIEQLAEQNAILMNPNKINIVTVARLGKEKGVFRAVEAIAGLGNCKDKIRYYIIGDGIERQKVASLITEHQLQDIVVCCGEKENPYGHIKAADLLLIPSFSEAAPLVIGEAAALGTGVLSTKTSSAEEMLEKTKFGWVCENSVEAMTESLRKLIENPIVLKEKKQWLRQQVFDNSEALCQFDTLLQ